MPKNLIKNYSTTATAISVLFVYNIYIEFKNDFKNTYPDEFPTTVESPAPIG